MAYMTALMDAAGVPRDQSAQLMTELGLQKDAGSRLSESEFSMLYRSLAVALDDEMLHFFSRPLRPGALKYTCLAVLDAKGKVLHESRSLPELDLLEQASTDAPLTVVYDYDRVGFTQISRVPFSILLEAE